LKIKGTLTKQNPCQANSFAITGYLGRPRRARWVIASPIRIIDGPLKKTADGAGEPKKPFWKSNRTDRGHFEGEQDQKKLEVAGKSTRCARLPEAHSKTPISPILFGTLIARSK
jgi:hypothetical protein